MAFVPTVLSPLALPGLLDYVLTTQSTTATTILIICSSRLDFLHLCLRSFRQHDSGHELGQFINPTLHNLFTATHIKVAFCASVQALLAYLAAYSWRQTTPVCGTPRGQRLVVVNPLALHAPTPAFSAQGLSRTFATAVETALETGALLHLVECQDGHRSLEEDQEEQEEMDMETRPHPGHDETDEQDPWEQQVSVLNVSARRLASGSGERAWTGRTVKAKSIAGRWFRFHKLDNRQANHPTQQ